MNQISTSLEIKRDILSVIEFEFSDYNIEEYKDDLQRRVYLIVENPKFKEDDGSDPNIIQEFLDVSKEDVQQALINQLDKFYQDSLPKYSDKGTIVAQINGKSDSPYYKWDVEVLEWDGSTHWIQEGMGFDYFFDLYFDDKDFPDPGIYIIENIVGHVFKGDGWTTDDDEDWEMDSPRKVTPEEVEEYQHYLDTPLKL
jgi:hypothetical protein